LRIHGNIIPQSLDRGEARQEDSCGSGVSNQTGDSIWDVYRRKRTTFTTSYGRVLCTRSKITWHF
jgi:hypothetical protein